MLNFLGKLLLSTLAVLLASEILPGIHIADPFRALLVALLISVLNFTIKPILILFTIPFTVVTFGLFLLVINGFMIIIAGKLISGFSVDGFGWAVLFSIVLSLVNSILEYFVFRSRGSNGPDNQ